MLSTTEYFHDGVFSPGPPLPFPLEWHCMAIISPTQVAILGGRPNSFSEDSAMFHIFDTVTEQFTEMPPMASARGGLGCGTIQSGGGVELVAAGGYSDFEARLTTSEIFNFESGEWRSGPETPYYFDSAVSLPFEDSFLIVGGDINHTILKFDVATMKFVILEPTLAHARYYGQAILIDNDKGVC